MFRFQIPGKRGNHYYISGFECLDTNILKQLRGTEWIFLHNEDTYTN